MLIGALSDRWGLGKAFFALPLLGWIAAGLLLVGSQWYERDLAKVERTALFDECVSERGTVHGEGNGNDRERAYSEGAR
jgi:hypothetical protein